MIFGNINNLSEFPFLEEQVKECFEYAKTHDLASYEKGSHEIDGDRLFVNIVEYTTTTPEERFWEAHKNYLDVHVMIHGNEQIDLNFIQNSDLSATISLPLSIIFALDSYLKLKLKYCYLEVLMK